MYLHVDMANEYETCGTSSNQNSKLHPTYMVTTPDKMRLIGGKVQIGSLTHFNVL